MSVIKYSLAKYGSSYKLSEHFTLGEMKCKDGSDTVLVSSELILMLEKLRAYGGFTISITSGYRTSAYNKKIGGASKSQHIQGTAADVIVKKDGKIVSGKLICCLCQTLGFKGVAWISDRATHLDMRSSGTYRGFEGSGYGNNVGGNFYTYFGISSKQVEALKVAATTDTTQGQASAAATNEEDDDDMRYATVNDVPDWGKEAVQLRIEFGYTDGTNLTESMVRTWVIQDREDPFIKNLADCPTWAQTEASELINANKLRGTGTYQIGMRLSVLRAIIIANR